MSPLQSSINGEKTNAEHAPPAAAALPALPPPPASPPPRTRRELAMLALLVLALLAAAGYSFAAMAAGRAAAARAAEDLAASRTLAARIVQLRDRPTLAGAQELEATELTRQIEAAAHEAQMPVTSLVRIEPMQARRLGESDYREKPTSLVLRGVTLPQAIRFFHRLSAGESGLRVSRLRLSAPRDEAQTTETWTVEAALSYLIYAPSTPGAGARGPSAGTFDPPASGEIP